MAAELIYRCVLVILVAWPGPRLVFHTHLDYAGTAEAGARLVRHLAMYHGTANSGNVDPDPTIPHSHWIFCWGGSTEAISAGTTHSVPESVGAATIAGTHAWDSLIREMLAFSAADARSAELVLVRAGWPVCQQFHFRGFFGIAVHRHLCKWIC